MPLAYFLTFSTYGTHLPGSDKGWVDARHCAPGTPLLPSNPGRVSYWQQRLNESPWTMDANARSMVLNAICSVCMHRQWTPHAVHVRTTHVHSVVTGGVAPERMLREFKAYSTRALRSGAADARCRYWTRHGSTRYLWCQASLTAAVDYVLNAQGDRLACYTQ